MEPLCRIELLGGLRLICQGRSLTRFATQKTGGLLAYLAYFGKRSHQREVLAEIYWPGNDTRAARNSLNTALSSLRHQLEPPSVSAGSVLQADRFSVRLNPEAFTSDIVEFEAGLRSAATASTLTDRLNALTETVALYRGELLPGHYEDWIAPEQQRLANLHVQALSQLSQLLEQSGDAPRALEYALLAVDANPLREEAHREVIRLYVATGQASVAQDHYRELERLLTAELGTTPSEATRQLLLSCESASHRQRRAPVTAEPAFSGPPSPGLPRSTAAPAPATATLTFLLTDIEGSTALWERTGDRFREAVIRHHALFRSKFPLYHGSEVQEGGDGFLVAFPTPSEAVGCAAACQRELREAEAHEAGDDLPSLRVRMAVHTGEVEICGSQYRGLSLHHASRLLSAAHGGQVLCSEATTALLRPNPPAEEGHGFRFLDLGVYRLRDIPEPQHLYQLQDPAAEQQEFPPPIAETGAAVGLPLQLTRFFGRGRELARLEELLLAEADRVVTLTGPGGTGKTRLAIATAERLATSLWGNVWFVPLADVSQTEGIVDALLDALRLQRLPLVSPLEQIVEALQRFARQSPPLLVLDNFEQIAVEGASFVETLLARVPQLKCLVTSRLRLDIQGEREFMVAPLPTPDAANSPESLLEYASVQLFVDRAQAARPDFQLTPGNAATLATLCERLEGLPLAIELAAARAQVLTPGQMLAQLENRYEFLVSRRRSIAERHRTLRAAVDWSYHLLSPELQHTYARLSVFRGGWTLEAAEAVCGRHASLDALEQLRECSLITFDDGGDGGAYEMRFRMMETLREYASELGTPDERAEVCRSHLSWFLSLAETFAPRLNEGGRSEALWRLEAELDNLRAALVWCGEDSPHLQPRLALALFSLLYHRGSWAEAQRYLEDALVAVGSSGDEATAYRARIQMELAGLCLDRGELGEARTLAGESLALNRSLDDQRGIAEGLNLLGILAMETEPEVARPYFEEVLRLRPDARGRALALHNLAKLATRHGNRDESRQLYEEALTHRRLAGDARGEAETLQNLGVLAHLDDDLQEAERLYLEGLALYRSAHYPLGIAMMLNNLGEIHEADGKLRKAVPFFVHSQRLLSDLRSRYTTFPTEALERIERLLGKTQAAEFRSEAERCDWEQLVDG